MVAVAMEEEEGEKELLCFDGRGLGPVLIEHSIWGR